MGKKRILLTGDDGYKSIGIRLLISLLRDDFDLKIAGPKVQQSGAGGKINLSGGKWERVEVDGIEGVSVTGSPSDAVEVARTIYGNSFDLVISGLNYGANVGTGFASGTVGAGVTIKSGVWP
jgi:5'-nucleotidase